MKLTTMTQVSGDGVMQAYGPSKEDRRNGFERDGWALGKADRETGDFITQTCRRAGAFLFDRRTYEMFAPYWARWIPAATRSPMRSTRTALGEYHGPLR